MLASIAGLLRESWPQRAILIGVIAWVFWDGLWAGVARADQIPYLHQVSQFDDLWQILSQAPSWNRIQLPKSVDAVLYRPILYEVLGLFYYLFGYDFVQWQIASLCLHLIVVLGLHLLLVQGNLRRTTFPLLISLAFGTALLGSELVLWNHLVGYLLFCALAVYSVYFFLRYLREGRRVFLLVSGGLGLLAEFTYELGALINLLFAATLLVWARTHHQADSSAPVPGRRLVVPAVLFVTSAAMLPLVSFVDLRARDLAFAPLQGAPALWKSLLLVAGYSIIQIVHWTVAWLIPTAYPVLSGERAHLKHALPAISLLSVVNAVGAAWAVIACARAVRRRFLGRASIRRAVPTLVPCLIFLFGYAAFIAVGRGLLRGVNDALQANVYYGYMAYLAFCVGTALIALAKSQDGPLSGNGIAAAKVISTPAGSDAPSGTEQRLGPRFAVAITCLTLANALSVRALAHDFRYRFAAPRQEMVDRVAAWRATVQAGSIRYFRVSPNCEGNETLRWFNEGYFRKGSGWRPPVALADVLWPDRSAILNSLNAPIPAGLVDEISCDRPSAKG